MKANQPSSAIALPRPAMITSQFPPYAGNDAFQQRVIRPIIQLLEKNEVAGLRPQTVFEDWLAIVEATLKMLPRHTLNVIHHGRPAEDDPDTAALWARLRERYPRREFFERFKVAFHLLLDGTGLGYYDAIGSIYMQYGYPSKGVAQYFTPWNIALLMAQMVVGDSSVAEVHKRLLAAIRQSPLAEAALIASLVLVYPDPQPRQVVQLPLFPESSPRAPAKDWPSDGQKVREAFEWFIGHVLPAAWPHYQPLRINEPTVGSGVMLLAAASCFEPWMVHLNLVQFSGQDIDPVCVQMARINLMLYGLNGYGLKLMLATQGLDPEVPPEAYQPMAPEGQGTTMEQSLTRRPPAEEEEP
jgi:hypothetical protein